MYSRSGRELRFTYRMYDGALDLEGSLVELLIV